MILQNREEIARVEVCERFFGLNNWPVPLRKTGGQCDRILSDGNVSVLTR